MIKDDLYIHENRSSVNLIKSLNFKEYVKYKFSFFIHLKNNLNKFNEYNDDAQDFYKDYLNNISREFYPSYDVFKSVTWTHVYLKKLDLYVFKKYLILLIYFILYSSFFSFIFSYTIIISNQVYWRERLLCFAFLYLGFLFLYALINWLIWKFSISKYIKFLNLYCLRSTYIKIQKLDRIGIGSFIVNFINKENLVINFSEISFLKMKQKL